MTEIAQLVPKPTLSEELKQECVEILGEALDSAEAGEVASVIVILKHPDGSWTERYSGTELFSEAIGRLEIVKHEWIRKYAEHCKQEG